MNGFPRTSIRAFGMSPLRSRMRVPIPPARMTHCMEVGLFAHLNDGPIKIELETHLLETFLRHCLTHAGHVIGIKQEKAAAAGTDEFASQRATGLRGVVPSINALVRHS